MATPDHNRMETTLFFSRFESIHFPKEYPTNEIPINGNNAEACPATMKIIFATKINESRREGLAIRYKQRKRGKKRKRNFRDVKSICKTSWACVAPFLRRFVMKTDSICKSDSVYGRNATRSRSYSLGSSVASAIARMVSDDTSGISTQSRDPAW